MQRFSKNLSVKATAVVALLVAPFMATAAVDVAHAFKTANVENGKNIFTNGKGDVPACQSCHGPEGLGEDAMGTPRLAGQGFSYIVKQLEDFGSDKRIDTTMNVMNTNAKGLSAQDRRDVAAFVYTLKQPDKGSNLNDVAQLGQPVGKSHLGKSIVTFGAPERGIPSCYSCHQFNGRGSFPVYPRLASQKYVYLVNQLKKWRDGSRANDPMAQMQKVAQKLTDDDIFNVASFLTNADLTTVGNDRAPHQEVP
ncbi:MAG: c-type cytochrome [Gammaproteobacteria bacterium]|nr:c-type cytochrome [Gammaproteobacteria bacterium]